MCLLLTEVVGPETKDTDKAKVLTELFSSLSPGESSLQQSQVPEPGEKV